LSRSRRRASRWDSSSRTRSPSFFSNKSTIYNLRLGRIITPMHENCSGL
jgi:hypothetical protein